MIWIYRLLYIPIFLLALPYYLRRMLKRGGYAKGFSQRFGCIPNLKRTSKKRIWIQAVSVGEVNAVTPLIDKLLQNNLDIVLTTTTSTGYALAQKIYKNKVDHIFIFPFDFIFTSMLFWSQLKPDLCILMEGEIWPEHIHRAHKKKIPVLLINARLSDKSFKRHKLFKCISKLFLNKINKILVSNKLDAERFEILGVAKDNLSITGNLKCDVQLPNILASEDKQKLLKEMGFSSNIPVLLGSSTWEGEELMLMEVQDELQKNGIPVNLLIVPRHAERKSQLLEILPKTTHYRSDTHQAPAGTRVYVADTTGELMKLSQLADLAFIGKSLSPNEGGQTPIEPALLGLPMVYGPRMSNFKYICRSLEETQSAVKCKNKEEVKAKLKELIQSPEKRQQLSQNALKWAEDNRGATDLTVKEILSFLL